jgi:5-methylcytosine-specific restriction protein A
LCAKHEEAGRLVPATVVDHKVPFRGPDGSIDQHLLWSRSNWQSLCKACHDSVKQAEDAARRRRGS